MSLFPLFLQVGVDVAHPGVANDFDDESAKKYYTYYQWVCFVLFFQVRIKGFPIAIRIQSSKLLE